MARKNYRDTWTDEDYRRHCEQVKAHQARQKEEDPEGFSRRNSIACAKWRAKNPEKRLAHKAVERAVKRGELVKPNDCERCNKPAALVGKLEASHFSYEPYMWLVVEFLCRPCHNKKDFRKRS